MHVLWRAAWPRRPGSQGVEIVESVGWVSLGVVPPREGELHLDDEGECEDPWVELGHPHEVVHWPNAPGRRSWRPWRVGGEPFAGLGFERFQQAASAI